MKRKTKKENFLAGRKALVLTIVCAMLLAYMSGCGEKQAADVSETMVKATGAEEKTAEKVETNEADVEESAEQTTEDFFKEMVEPWLIETGKQGIAMAVWNEVDNMMYVIGEGEDYTRKEGDRFFLCTPSKLHEFGSHSSIDSETFCSVQVEKLENNYCEFIFAKSEVGVNELSIEEISCVNNETGKICFNLVEDGYVYVKEEIIEVPDGYEYYLKDSAGEKVLGFNLPEDYSVEFVSGAMASLYSNSNTDRIYLSTAPEMQGIYDGLSDTDSFELTDEEGNVETYESTYIEKGTYETLYGIARLYDDTTYAKKVDFECTLYSQIALIKVNEKYYSISYSYDEADYPNPAHDITWVLQQLFE